MNIEELTLKQIREIQSLGISGNVNQSDMLRKYIGEYVIVRSYNEGLNAGTVKDIDETGVILSDARRLYYHKPSNNESWYEGVAQYGLSNDSKVSIEVEKVIAEKYSLTLCSKQAEESIKSHASYTP